MCTSKFGVAGLECQCCQCMFPPIPIPSFIAIFPAKLSKDGYYPGDRNHVDLCVSQTANFGMAIL